MSKLMIIVQRLFLQVQGDGAVLGQRGIKQANIQHSS